MKKLQLFICAALVSVCGLQAQQEAMPNHAATAIPGGDSTEALFDFQFTIDVGSAGTIGTDGLAGIIFFNDQYWVSAWASDEIHILDNTGAYIETLFINGLTGTRALTTDGTLIYSGTAGTTIFAIDPVTQMIDDTIDVTTTSDATARMVTYDATLDGGNGGFWIGNFSSDIASVDMNGNELSVIPLATHGTAIYGGAVDNVSPGGPFLWIHDQTPADDTITQLQLPAGTPTGVSYNYITSDAPAGTTGISGGLFITDAVTPDTTSLLGMCQCTPSNLIFAVELLDTLGTDDNALTSLSIAPNPANGDVVSINTATNGTKAVAIYNMLGKKLIEVTTQSDVNISSLAAGVYLVNVTEDNVTATKKLIVQ